MKDLDYLGQLGKILDEFEKALDEFFRKLEGRLLGQPAQAFYTVEEFAELVKRTAYTVRNWCWRGRINTERSETQAGKHQRYVISHQELQRYKREGLLKLKGV